jgi:hypothetical protein
VLAVPDDSFIVTSVEAEAHSVGDRAGHVPTGA